MKKTMSILVILLAVSSMVFATGQRQASQEKAKIVFCVNVQPQIPLNYWQSIANKFMAAYPNVTVEIISQPSSNVDIFQYEKTLLATGQFPDVMVMQNPADFVPSGALLAFNEGELSYLQDPNVGKINGRQYVANYKKQIIGVYYNKKIFADNGLQVPKTYREFISLCDTLKAKGIIPVSIGIRDVDGARWFQRFFRITLPLLAPGITINSILSVAGGLKQYDHVKVITGGGPGGATQTATLFAVEKAFEYNRRGYSSAAILVIFIAIVILSLIQLSISKKYEVEY